MVLNLQATDLQILPNSGSSTTILAVQSSYQVTDKQKEPYKLSKVFIEKLKKARKVYM